MKAVLPAKEAVRRTAEERWARAVALRCALGPVAGWSEDARFDVVERAAVLAADGVADADRAAEELVRADLLRRAP